MMYCQIVKANCPDGYAFVRDYMGNKIFYGTIEECLDCLDIMNGLKKKRKIKKERKCKTDVHS